jgi:hypothetical protein
MANERKGKKLRRCTAASKNYYKLQFGKTDDNRKKRMQRHLRSHPMDAKAVQSYEGAPHNYGRADTIGLTGRGKKRKRRAEREQRAAA